MASPASLAAPAKINLALHVTGRRADGYHLLETLVVFTRLGDRLSVAPAPADRFVVSGRFAAGIPSDAGNLVIRARERLRALRPRETEAPVSITLEKNLPPASGIGGGSSDAAAALRLLSRFWGIEWTQECVAAFAGLGADVPMCLLARPLVARGTGERTHLVAPFPALPMVVVNPGVEVSTAEVFRSLKTPDNPPLPLLPPAPTLSELAGWLGGTRNDLEAAALLAAPAISDARAALDAAGALFARMSGSGATCFGIFDSRKAAEDAARAIETAHPGWFVAATAGMASDEVRDGRN